MPRTVQPVLFVPNDCATAPVEAYRAGLWQATGEALRWFRAQTDRNVFQALPVVDFFGHYEASRYAHNTQEQVALELSGTWPSGRDGIAYLCYGIWGEAPYLDSSNIFGTTGDYLVVQSSTSLETFVHGHFAAHSPGEWWNSRLAQTGAMAHELGHTLGLPHTNDTEPALAESSVMYAWWTFPRCGLTPREHAQVLMALEQDRGAANKPARGTSEPAR